MSLAYDEVVEAALEACESAPAFATQVRKALLVRTVTGQVRLAVELEASAERSFLDDLSRRVEGALGRWFQAPVICPSRGPSGLSQLAEQLLAKADAAVVEQGWEVSWPMGWPNEVGLPGQRVDVRRRWRALQVTLGKEPWLAASAGEARPPWPLRADQPRITAFYGFKGGVGRSTTVAVLAWRLAQVGRSVVCVDLDLEAPGLTRLLLSDELPPDRGYVIDELLSAAATGSGLDRLPLVPVTVHGVSFELAPAGVLGPTYIEKLARLDTLHRNPGKSPVHQALEDLLRRIRSRPEGSPDHILLDCRSGLHDLAGLALHDLAHVDVLVGRGERQELDGLQVLLPALLRRRQLPALRLLVLRTFMPGHDLERRLEIHRSDLHDLFARLIYPDEPPSPTDRGLAHDPCPIQYREELAYADGLPRIGKATLMGEEFGEVLARLDVLWRPEEEST